MPCIFFLKSILCLTVFILSKWPARTRQSCVPKGHQTDPVISLEETLPQKYTPPEKAVQIFRTMDFKGGAYLFTLPCSQLQVHSIAYIQLLCQEMGDLILWLCEPRLSRMASRQRDGIKMEIIIVIIITTINPGKRQRQPEERHHYKAHKEARGK